jgi:GTPase involved in cell partitioning and DNA repair
VTFLQHSSKCLISIYIIMYLATNNQENLSLIVTIMSQSGKYTGYIEQKRLVVVSSKPCLFAFRRALVLRKEYNHDRQNSSQARLRPHHR